MPVVRELLDIYQLRDIKVLAGMGGLENRVGTVTVMEVPETTRYLRGDDFLITSLYSVGKDAEKQCELVHGLLETKSACLAIKLGKYAEQLSQEMLKIANDNEFPLLLIPPDMTYIQIIMSVMNAILTEKSMEAILEKFVQDVLFETYSDEQLMVERARILDINLTADVFQMVIIQFTGDEVIPERQQKMLKFMSRQLLAYVREFQQIETASLLTLKNHAVLLLEGKSPEALEANSTYLKQELLKRMNHGFPHSSWKMGMGCIAGGLAGIRQSYTSARKVIETGLLLREDEDIYIYQDLKLYCQLREMLMQNSISFYKEGLGNIENEALIQTLEVYYACDCNLDQTAQEMYTHKNTVKYRLKKIKELTGLDVKRQEDSFKIHLMLLEKKLRGGHGDKKPSGTA